MTGVRELAPAKLNLCLFVGPTRPDGRHELVTVFQPIALTDVVELEPAGLGAVGDRVECAGVDGDNLAGRALRAFRARSGWRGAPVRLRIEKRIPIAGGMAGGSADAGAALRLAARVAGVVDDGLLREVAIELGADVPAQVRPRRYLASGVGERLTPLPAPRPYGVLVLPARERLATADVFATADRLGLARPAPDLDDRLRAVSTAAADLPDELVANDLEPAARELCPAIDEALAQARAVGARRALVCGSGPTVVGLFDDLQAARGAAARLADRDPRPIAVAPWGATL